MKQDYLNTPLSEVRNPWVRIPVTVFLSILAVPLCGLWGLIDGAKRGFVHFTIECIKGPKFKYEVFIKHEPEAVLDMCGWFPISTDSFDTKRIVEYIEKGIIREIQ